MNKLLPILCLSILCFSCKQQQDSSKASAFDSLKDSLTSELTEIHKLGQINGFGVALVNEKGTLFEAGIGYADVKGDSKYTENTIQNIGSVSKTLIGIALLKAQEMGKLHLDDPVNNYLPYTVVNPNFPNDIITIRQLATHSSSILDTDFYNSKAYILKDEPTDSTKTQIAIDEQFNAPDAKIPMLDFLGKMLSDQGEWYLGEGFSKNRPGTIFEYSNIGATLAAAVLEVAVGQPYDLFTAEHILQPLKMETSGWSFDQIALEKHSTLYADPENELPYYSLITYPDGGLITSVSDLGKYLTGLIQGQSGNGILLNPEGYAELFKEQLPAESFLERDEEDDYDDEYNTGIFMGFTPKGYIGHTGGDPGIATYMFFDPKTKIGRILMINTSIRNSEGVEEFYAIWNTLGDYEEALNREANVIPKE